LGLPQQGAIAFAGPGGTTATIRRLLHERPDAIATTTTQFDRHGFSIGLLLTATDTPALARLARAARSVRPLTLALDAGAADFVAPPVAFLRQLARDRGLVVYACDAADRGALVLPRDRVPAWPPVALARVVLVANLQGLGMSLREVAPRPADFAARSTTRVNAAHYAAMLSAYADVCPPSTPITVLLTGVTPSRVAVARTLAEHIVQHVRGRNPLLLDPRAAVRVVVTPEVDTGAFEILASDVQRRPRATLHGVCAIVLTTEPVVSIRPATRGRRQRMHPRPALSAWLRARPAALVVVVPRDAPDRAARAAVAAARAGIPVRVVTDPGRGPGSALRAAARAVPPGFALLIGTPTSDRALIHALGDLGTTMRRAILVPVRGAQETQPVFYPADLRGALARSSDAAGGELRQSNLHRIIYLRTDEDTPRASQASGRVGSGGGSRLRGT